MTEYTKKVMNNFLHPKNMGEMKNPDAVGKVGSPVCGDVSEIYLKVVTKKEKKIIKEIKFKTFGCAAAIASSSMLTQIVKGKTLEEAKKITQNDLAKSLGSLPSVKLHCSELAISALKKAIENYEKKITSKTDKFIFL